MKKSKGITRPKTTTETRQGDLFRDGVAASSPEQTGSLRQAMRAELQSRLRDQRALTTGIVDKIGSYANLAIAFKRVDQNGGAAGVDGVSVDDYRKGVHQRLERLSVALVKGSYRPQAVRAVEIAKPNGGVRQLGIPTVEDRVVQQAIHQCLSPVYEPYFSDHSYGFRPGRSAHQAIERAAGYVQTGKVWVADVDLKSFFDEIQHERLLSRLGKAIADKRLLRLIGQFLRAGVLLGGLVQQRTKGTPQGGPLSPLLSNIVLDELDRELTLRGLSFVRYADDFNIFVGSERSARRVLGSVTKFLETKMKLKVNAAKSGVRRCDQVTFLGFTVERTGKVRISDANVVKFKKRIKQLTKRNRGRNFKVVIDEVNRTIRGWGTYFRPCNTWLSDLRDLDGWVRNRLRVYRLRQCRRVYPTYLFLRQLGLGMTASWRLAKNGGWKWKADYPTVRNGMGLAWFRSLGLLSVQAIQSG